MNLSQQSRSEGNPLPDKPVLVVGIGNPLRADDSVGRIVAAEIKRRNLPFLQVIEHTGEGASLIMLWEKARTVIVVDAMVTGAAAGTVHRFDAVQEPLPGWLCEVSTHHVGLVQAVELARVMNRLPPRLVLYGIEGRIFEIGGELSIEVQNAVPEVVERVIEELRLDMQPLYGT